MATTRVLNLTTKCYLKIRQAEGRIEHCVSEWVVQGKSIRDLNLAQIVQKRSEQAKQITLSQEVLGSNEVPGLRFVGPANPIYNRNAYEEMDSPLGVRTCHWPRIAEANRLAAQNGTA